MPVPYADAGYNALRHWTYQCPIPAMIGYGDYLIQEIKIATASAFFRNEIIYVFCRGRALTCLIYERNHKNRDVLSPILN